MRYANYLDIILGQKTKIKALRYIVNYNDQISIRALGRAIKVTPPNLSRILTELMKEGVLTSREYGRSVVFSLNRGHYLVDRVIVPLFADEKTVINEFKKVFLKNFSSPFESIILFGSVARRSERPHSDIDLAIIIGDKNKHLKEIVNENILEANNVIMKKFGNQLSPYILTKKEFVQKYKNNDPLVSSIIKDGEILSGKIISELL